VDQVDQVDQVDASSDEGRSEFAGAVGQYLTELLEEHPTQASFLGLREQDHRLGDYSAEGFARREESAAAWLERFDGFDPSTLAPGEPVDLALLQAHLGRQVATAGFAGWRRNVTTYLENGVFELFVHANRAEKDAVEAAVARLAQVPAVLEAGRENLDPTLMHGELASQWGVRNVRAQVAFMRQGLGPFVADAGLRAKLEEAGRVAADAYAAFASAVEAMAARADGSYAFGEERYDAVLRIGEGFGFGARELREMGRAQVEEIDGRMREVAGRIAGGGGGATEWRAVARELRDQHPASMEDMLRAYRDETAKARAFVAEHRIVPLPEGEVCAVEPAPLFLRNSAPVASYFPPAYVGAGSGGTFNVPFTSDDASEEERAARLHSNSFFEIPAVTVHEAYPGHHLHFAAATVTNMLRQVLTSTYMVEGWGLYVEQMMAEAGYYESDQARLGQLSARLFRAGRMVVDTSLHLGDMTMDEATAFMSERCGLPEQTARGEVLRYCSWPTQASAYLTGALEIERMAGHWTAGGHGSLAEFHQALVTSGKLPLGVAARAIGLV
jgi:uncharacterized protein (DUF885 family)